MEAILRAENVGYVYQSKCQRTRALSGVTCDFVPGKLYAITGKSGSGKSTFLSLLAGLDVPSEGALYAAGRDTRKMDRDRYRRDQVAVIYQAFHLFPLLNVRENVMFPMLLQQVPKKEAARRAEELLAKVGIGEKHLKKMPGMLSGGEQQRVAIARAMASGAKILLADEPTGNLDTQNEAAILDLLRQMAHEDGYTVIMVTHSRKMALASDVIYEMSDGTLEVSGT